MTPNQPDRLDRIETILENFIAASSSDRASSNERITLLEQLSEKTDARFNQLAKQQERIIAEADANREITFMMLEQMTALQEESKQILDYLFGQQRNGKGDQPNDRAQEPPQP